MRDYLQYRLGILKDLIVPETQDVEALGFEVSVSLGVELPSFGGLMHVPVALYDQFCFVAVEIADVIAKLVLAAELRVAELPVT